MKKFRKLLALVVLVMLIVTSTVSGVASTTLTDAQLLQQYAVNFVKRVEHIGNIEVDWTMEMHDLANDNPIAQYISLNPTGYIIVGVNPPTVYEYSLSDQLMNTRSTKEVILSGPFSYYTKEGNDYIHLKTNEHFSKSQLSNGAIDFQIISLLNQQKC